MKTVHKKIIGDQTSFLSSKFVGPQGNFNPSLGFPLALSDEEHPY
jgi:hypothetical protein